MIGTQVKSYYVTERNTILGAFDLARVTNMMLQLVEDLHRERFTGKVTLYFNDGTPANIHYEQRRKMVSENIP